MTLNELIQQALLLKQQGFGDCPVRINSKDNDFGVSIRSPIKCLSALGKSTVLIEKA